MHACVYVSECVQLNPSEVGNPTYSLRACGPEARGTGKGQGQGESHFGPRSGLSTSYTQPWEIGGAPHPSSPGVGLQFHLWSPIPFRSAKTPSG